MSLKFCLPMLVIFSLMISFCPLHSTATDASVVSISISIPDEKQQNSFGNPVIVTGIWHYVNVTMSEEISQLSLVLYGGHSIPIYEKRNETNYYEWEYNADVWRDKSGYSFDYIQESNCIKNNKVYSFYIGIDSEAASTVNWTLDVLINENSIYSVNISIEQQEFIDAFSSQFINPPIQIDPFTESAVIADHLYEIKAHNIPCNLVIYLSNQYAQYADNININNYTHTTHENKIYLYEALIHPNEIHLCEITVNPDNWRPGIIHVNGNTTYSPRYYITSGWVALTPQPDLYPYPEILIRVGHSNYEIYESPENKITFQYENEINLEYNEIKNLTTYICGNGNITINVIPPLNITILKIVSGNKIIGDMPFTVNSTNASEHPIITQIHATKENTTAYINYELEINGEKQTFTTKINVGPKPVPEDKPADTTLIMIAIGVCIIAVIGYMIYSQMKYRRR